MTLMAPSGSKNNSAETNERINISFRGTLPSGEPAWVVLGKKTKESTVSAFLDFGKDPFDYRVSEIVGSDFTNDFWAFGTDQTLPHRMAFDSLKNDIQACLKPSL